MKPIVLDPSAAAAWVIPDEANEAARDLYVQACDSEGVFHAPQLWSWEMGNLLVMGHVRKRLSPELVEQGLEMLALARISFDGPPTAHRQAQITRLALAHSLTYYDAAYLELVLRLNGQLASADKNLLAAAKACGIVCLTF